MLGGRATRKNLIGIDIATILWDGMLRGSLLYLSPDAEGSYFISSAGYEYTFSNGLYTLVEGFYNQNALNRNNALAQAYNMSIIQGLNEELYAKLSDQFLTANRYYLGIALGYEISPLLRGELFTISDIDGRGVFLSPSLTYNLLQNLDISISGMFGYIFEDVSDVSDFKEFSEHPLLNVSLKWYF